MRNDLDLLLDELQLTPQQARACCGLSPRQWRRYRSGTATLPERLRRLLRLYGGLLGEISALWAGWRLEPRSGALLAPWGERITPEWLQGLPLYFARLAAERAELRTALAVARSQPSAQGMTRSRVSSM